MNACLVIKNGKIVTPSSAYYADLKAVDGKIVEIASEIAAEGTVIDASGKYVLPGAVDVHTHLELPFNKTTSADDYREGTIAAAFGGTTTVFNYLNQKKQVGLIEMMQRELNSAGPKACVDYAFHIGITNFNDATKKEMEDTVREGVTSFKVYTTYREEEMMIEEADFRQILEHGKNIGALICVHAENNDPIEYNRKHFVEEGKTSPWYHYLSRPEIVEAQAVKRVICLAEKIGAPLYMVHLAAWEGYEAVKKAKEAGYPILAETCPQYLEFTKTVYQKKDAAQFVCSPPMKGEKSRKALWKGLLNGTIDVVATDHCPFTSEQKKLGQDDFTKIPNGCMGVENRYPYLLGKAAEGVLPFTKVVETCCFNPARIFGCAAKGSLEIGKDADIVIYNPEGSITVSAGNMHSAVDYTIWEGVNMKGSIETTILRGNVIVDQNRFLGKPGEGSFLSRGKSSIYS